MDEQKGRDELEKQQQMSDGQLPSPIQPTFHKDLTMLPQAQKPEKEFDPNDPAYILQTIPTSSAF